MEKEINGKIIKALYEYVVTHKGKTVARSLLEDLPVFAGQPYAVESLLDEHAWFPIGLQMALAPRLEKLFPDEENILFVIQSENILKRKYGTLEGLLRGFLPSPSIIYDKLDEIVRKDFNKISIISGVSEGKNRVVIKYRMIDKYFPTTREGCGVMRATVINCPTLFGYDPARVVETECSVPIDRKGSINGKFYRINDKKEVLEFARGDDEKIAPGKVIGRLAVDGTFKLGETVYGTPNCVYHVSWKEKSLWARTFGQYFHREEMLRKVADQLLKEKVLLEQKYEEIDRLNSVLEEKVRKRTEQLEQSNKLKDLFISIMDHDIKNNLTSVLGYSSLLKSGEVGPSRNYGEIINREAVKINDLISEARVFSGLQDPDLKKNFQRLDLGEIIESVVPSLRAKAGRRGLTLAVDVPVGRFFFDGLLLANDIFMNLIDNAIKYAEKKSTIDVYIEESPGKFVFCVRDRGKGIPDEYKSLVFNRFERIDSRKKEGIEGSGLGLAIVKALVALHRGRVWVEDDPAGGAIFKVEMEKMANE